MAQVEAQVVAVKAPRKTRSWWKVLLLGLLFYVVGMVILILTGNPNLFPTVILIGNFVVPAAYVSFFYERRHWSRLNMPAVAMGFLYGGVLGVFGASLLEPLLVRNNIVAPLVVGLIEESVKILGVLVMLRHRRHDGELDGLILGAAAGMGFAALESMGYAFTALIQNGGGLSATVGVTLLRGVLAPLGHGTWTAILAAVIFRESDAQHFHINLRVLGAYLTVVVLHGLWDAVPMIVGSLTSSNWYALASDLVVGAVGLLILWGRYREAMRRQQLALVTEGEGD